MEDEKQMDLALWRYSIISPLLHREANEKSLREALSQMALDRYVHPDGKTVLLSPETIRKWLYRFNAGGLPALSNKQRCDKGRYDVPDSLAEVMFEIRKNHPRWTLALIFSELIKTGHWDGKKPSRSSLYRFAKARNLMRDPHLQTANEHRSFVFEKFGQLWMADFLHGPKIRVRRTKKKTYLHAIMDDSSRYVVGGKFYFSEKVESLIEELMKAGRIFGLPQRFYVDNGSAYSSRHLKIVCARLSMHLIHTRPYQPEGRAKIERFFRTVRDQFLAGHRFVSLEQMNRELAAYLAEYHQRPHRTLSCSPLEKRLNSENVCRSLPEVADLEALFGMEKRCRVYLDGTIRLKKRIFEVPGCLPGGRVTVYFMPWDLSRVYYGKERLLAKPLDRAANAKRFQHPNSTIQSEGNHD